CRETFPKLHLEARDGQFVPAQQPNACADAVDWFGDLFDDDALSHPQCADSRSDAPGEWSSTEHSAFRYPDRPERRPQPARAVDKRSDSSGSADRYDAFGIRAWKSRRRNLEGPEKCHPGIGAAA